MTMRVSCSCGKQLAINESLAGKRVKCPACQNVFVAPAPPGQEAAADPVPPAPRPPARPTPPPPAQPKKKRPAGRGGALSFDHPDVRAERLMVLTHGQEPTEMYSLGKTVLTRHGSQVNWFCNVMVCDTGLLVVPYSHHNPAQHNAAAAHGLVGAAVGAIASAIAHSKANKMFAEKYEETIDWDPVDLFTGVTKTTKSGGRASAGPQLAVHEQMGAEFMPADELSAWKWTKASFQVKWRDRVHKFVRANDAGPDANRAWDRFGDEYEDWQDQGSEELEKRTGGPDEASFAALLEWGNRPVATVPAWVGQAVAEQADADLAKEIKTYTPPWKTVGRLAGKLEEVPGGGQELAGRLRELASKKATPLWIGAAVTGGLTILGAAVSLLLSVMEVEGLPVVGWIGTVVMLIVALILMVMANEVSGGFKKGYKAVTGSTLHPRRAARRVPAGEATFLQPRLFREPATKWSRSREDDGQDASTA